jgi:arginase
VTQAAARRVRRIVVPYHHAEPLPKLADAFAADDAVIVSKGPAGAMIVRLYDQVAARVAASDVPVVVASGDCTTALAIVAGLQRRNLAPGVIWLDAHGDFHTPLTTRSGYFGGMALAMLTGRAGASFAQSIGLHAIADGACVLAGARALDPAERAALDASALHRVDDVAALADTVALALRALASRGTIAALGLACTLTPKAFEQSDPLATIAPLIDAAFVSSARSPAGP